jgi:predicted KAP-like P-loop ATPase
MFDADRPILSSQQDRLGRAVFSKYLARCMLDHRDPDSLVVGLYGGWGVGKTSIINMVVEELNFAASNMEDKEKPIILNFSPWSYSGQNQLIYSFFRRLSSALRNVGYLEDSNRIIHLLELYVSFFTQKPVPTSLRTKRSWFERLTFKGREEVYAWESGRDLTLVKAELNELLRQQKHKIIIIIDNISRLHANEIKQIFQIVKSMGDYANTIYLLSLDKDQVVHTINKTDGEGGEGYVEKIVQLPFDVPPIQRQDLESILADRLNEVIKMVPDESWNIEYWADIYYSSLRYFFANCRDITRYINTLSFGYPRLRDTVNPVDFFALSVIEVFLPTVHAGIRDNKDLFTDLLDQVYAFDSEQIKKDKIRCDEILARNTEVPRDVLLMLLLRLFPRLRHIYQPKVPFYYSDKIARKLRRISSPDLFDVYFRLSMQTGNITYSEFETLLSLADNNATFDHALMRLNQDDRVAKFLDQLDNTAVIKSIPKNNIPIIVNALLDNSDLFPQGITGPLSLETPLRIHRIIHELLLRFDTSEDRFAILQHAIANATKSIYSIVYELNIEAREHQEESATFLPLQFRLLEPSQLDSLRQLAMSRIENWAATGRLAEIPHMLPVLYAWRDWGGGKACLRFVADMTDTDRGLVAFLTSTLNGAIAQAMTHYEKNPEWEKYLSDIEAFISVAGLKEHAKLLFEDEYFEKLQEEQQLALMIFLDLIKADTNKFIRQTSV